jgi:hypothetical protein
VFIRGYPVFIPVTPCDIEASGNAARGTRMTRTRKKGMNTDGRGLFREAKNLIRVHPWISVFIPVKSCDIDAGARQRQPDPGFSSACDLIMRRPA